MKEFVTFFSNEIIKGGPRVAICSMTIMVFNLKRNLTFDYISMVINLVPANRESNFGYDHRTALEDFCKQMFGFKIVPIEIPADEINEVPVPDNYINVVDNAIAN